MELNQPSTIISDCNMTPLEKFMQYQKFGADLRGEIRSISNQMNCDQGKTIAMCLRMHFNLPVPDNWKKDSWTMKNLEMVRD